MPTLPTRRRHSFRHVLLPRAAGLLLTAHCALAQPPAPPQPALRPLASTPAAVPAPLAFDVASIHPSHATDGHRHIYSSPNDSQFRSINLTAKELIQFAWDIPETQIAAAPLWADSLTFDIDAKSGPDTDARMHDLSSDQGKMEKQQMAQALLADRFALKTHPETRQLPVYSLVVSNPKTGPKFKPSKTSGTTIDEGGSRIHIQGGDNTMTFLARMLALSLGRPVIDNTGLTGCFDVKLAWTPADAAANPAPDAPPDIFTAIQDQLGLKLESTKGPVPILVIDHIELPSEN
jgi:uncharacterized protein (TIGR03435 family)